MILIKMKDNTVVETIRKYVSSLLGGETTGHDFFHAERVEKTALYIASKEGGDSFIISVSCLLHDVDDVKLFPDEKGELLHAQKIMEDNKLSKEEIGRVKTIIHEVSFKGTDSVSPSTLEGKIVQDADRLDALGALGIARTFAYGGAKGREIYNPSVKPALKMNEKEYRSHVGTSINHFYEKLLKLEKMLNTKTAKEIGRKRTSFMEEYLDEFFSEWNGDFSKR
jgi:uncharacterized protein